MIQCKISGKYHPSSVLCAFLSQNNLKEQLIKSVENRKNTPKTFPVEFKAASSPPVYRDDDKESIDRAVLAALARANQNATKTGNLLIPYSKLVPFAHGHEVSLKMGNLSDVKRAAHGLAEQFILKYPDSFKIRYSDKMSLGKLTYIEEMCRDKKLNKAKNIFEEIVTGNKECVEDMKKDMDALLDLFAFYNASEKIVDWPVSYNEKNKVDNYTKRVESVKGEVKEQTVELPYSKSLLKTIDVEKRNVELVVHDIMSSDGRMTNRVSARQKDKLLDEYFTEPGDRMGMTHFKKEAKRDGKRLPTPIVSKNLDMLPAGSEALYVSVMDSSAFCLQALQYMKDECIVSGENYDCVIQSAVRFYRPDLAWGLYEEMRKEGLYPSTATISDLIYSITHDMAPEEFVKTGAPVKIKRILTDLAESPAATISDDIFLHLFYGVHLIHEHQQLKEEEEIGNFVPAQSDHRTEKVPFVVDEKWNATRAAIHKYNYHILNEMEQCLKKGMFKMRYSTGYRILEMNNLTVGDSTKPWFTIDLNNSMYDLFHHNPHFFIRDLENYQCVTFIMKLLSYARIQHKSFDIEKFYLKHRDDLKAINDYCMRNPTFSHITLMSIIRFELTHIKGGPLPTRQFTRLEDIRSVDIFDYYNDFIRDNLEHMAFRQALDIVSGQMYKYLNCLNPYSTNVDYMLGLYKIILEETIKVSEKCVRSDDAKHKWSVQLLLFLEEYFNDLHSKYLVNFFLNEDTRRATIFSEAENNSARNLVLSEANILDVIDMVTKGMTLLLNNEAVPTTIMTYILVSFTFLSGEPAAAWKMVNVYNAYSIPLESSPLLKFIELTPNWKEEGDTYLLSVAEPLQAKIRLQIKEIERHHEKDIGSVSRMPRFEPPHLYIRRDIRDKVEVLVSDTDIMPDRPL